MAPISEVSKLLKRKKVSSKELTQAMFARIDRIDSSLLSYSSINAEKAMEQAQEADFQISSGKWKGALHGIPIAVKDLVEVEGYEMSCGSPFLSGNVSAKNAAIVSALKSAGAIILGKTAMTEFALAGYNPAFEPPKNPWNENHAAGVSSSGSAVAAAARLCFGAIGTDTGGSIRMPSLANGVVGIKPSYGRVSKRGCFPLSLSLDHVGPIAKSVEDAAIILACIDGYDELDPDAARFANKAVPEKLGKGVKGMRIGVDWSYCETNVDPEMFAAVKKAASFFEAHGAVIVEVKVEGIEAACDQWYSITGIEAVNQHKDWYPAKAAEYGPTFRGLLEHGSSLTGAEVAEGYQAFAATRRALQRVMSNVDIMICPTDIAPAPPLEMFPPDLVMPAEAVATIMTFIAPYNFSGFPTVSLPSGVHSSGLPLSLQIVGKLGGEAPAIEAAYHYEAGHDWKNAIPPSAI